MNKNEYIQLQEILEITFADEDEEDDRRQVVEYQIKNYETFDFLESPNYQ
jgi:hypothetical protein